MMNVCHIFSIKDLYRSLRVLPIGMIMNKKSGQDDTVIAITAPAT
jgi:hypothetical protein